MKSITMPKCNEDVNNIIKESNKEPNEFEIFFKDKEDEFISDVDNAKNELLYFLNDTEIGAFATPADYLIEFVDDCCIIEDITIIESQYEAYCVKVINEALKDAYESGKVKLSEWDFEKHSGMLHIDALF